MKIQQLLFGLLLMGGMADLSTADIVSSRVIDFRDDAEEETTGPNTGNVFRTSLDLAYGNQNGIGQWVGLRFQSINIPRGATINSAEIIQTARLGNTDVGHLIIPIVGELSPDTIAFGDLTPLTTRPLTTAQVNWDVDPWFGGDSGANTTTPDISSIVQEIVNQNGWSTGHSMVFLFRNDPLDSSERLAVSFDNNPNQAALLTIDFTVQTVPEPSGSVVAFLTTMLFWARRRIGR